MPKSAPRHDRSPQETKPVRGSGYATGPKPSHTHQRARAWSCRGLAVFEVPRARLERRPHSSTPHSGHPGDLQLSRRRKRSLIQAHTKHSHHPPAIDATPSHACENSYTTYINPDPNSALVACELHDQANHTRAGSQGPKIHAMRCCIGRCQEHSKLSGMAIAFGGSGIITSPSEVLQAASVICDLQPLWWGLSKNT
jgi:hypothetical protein